MSDALHVRELVERLERQRATLITYLRSKLDSTDWHAVQDAASDIREIEAQLTVLKELHS